MIRGFTLALTLLLVLACQPRSSDKDFQSLTMINQIVNQIPYKTDYKNYAQEDYWATADEMLETGAGDCEDYAIRKASLIEAQGLAKAEDMHIVVVTQTLGDAHAILFVKGYILDNIYDSVYPYLQPWYTVAYTVPYTVAKQGMGKVLEWLSNKE